MYTTGKEYQSSADSPYDCLMKILMIGNSHVGKSCMLLRYTENLFTNNFYNTIGVDFKTKIIQVDNKTVKLQIWDTAGQDRFRTITNNYYRGAHGILIVYDVTDRNSFDNIQQWMQDTDKYSPEHVVRILVGNKIDVAEGRKVSMKEGQKLANTFGCSFMETSAKNASNIEQTFRNISKQILDKMGQTLLLQLKHFKYSSMAYSSVLIQAKQYPPKQVNNYQKKPERGGCC